MTRRTFICKECRTVQQTHKVTGALPTTCKKCDPEGYEKRKQRRQEKNQINAVRRQKLALTDDLLWHFSHALINRPGRAAIVMGVKQVGMARGPKATRTALLQLAGACLAWAVELSPGNEIFVSERLDVVTSHEISTAVSDGRQAVGQ